MMLWKAVSLLTLVYILSKCEACNETHVGADSGVLQSPNFPHNYPDEVYCSWSITVNQPQHVILMFSTRFNLQDENNTDAVYVYDGGNTTGEVLGVFYGGHPPPTDGLYSSSNKMFVVFKSDNNKSFSGFKASYHALTCSDPLGMESKIITDAQISVSSSSPQTPRFSHYWSFHVWYWSPSNVRLNNFGWRANRDDQNQWIKVDLRRYTKVTRVATQGGRSRNYGVSGWVTNFKILYSLDGVLWQMYKEPGNSNASVKVFTANPGSHNTIVYNRLNETLVARYIKILPVAWHLHISMRIEIYGCQGCIASLGMENGAIADAQISASSQYDRNNGPQRARLNGRGGWRPRTSNRDQWLQVDLEKYTTVSRIATQGRSSWRYGLCVTRYRLQYSDDGVNYHSYKARGQDSVKLFNGNRGYYSSNVVINDLSRPITTRYIRILPVTWSWYGIAIRMEIYGCPACEAPLGMESEAIADSQISASSQLDDQHFAAQARLHLKADGSTSGGWSALTNDVNQWLQVDFGSSTTVTRIATQGEYGYNNWVTEYKLQYSDDGINFHFFKEVGKTSTKLFAGNRDSETVVHNKLRPPIKTRFIRLLPTRWNKQISMRIEIYGCPDCIAPIGMESGAISDVQISASSNKDDSFAASRARLLVKKSGIRQGGWSPIKDDLNQWLQVDLGRLTTVTRLATQGRDGSDEWVTKYTLQYSVDGVLYHGYRERGETSLRIFDGNQNSYSVVYNKVNSPVTVRFVRLLPIEWYKHICIRMEIYGCPGCMSPLGLENGAISDAQISASSQWDNNLGSHRARLNGNPTGKGTGAWCALNNDKNQWLQVDLGRYTTVTYIATQGRSDSSQWVTKYWLQYSDDGVNFLWYKDLGDGSVKLFGGNSDRNTIVYQTLSQPIRARYVRILPEAWYGHISMRMELYGCPACEAPLGMESKAISDSQISASSQLDENLSPAHSRLHNKSNQTKGGAWSALRNNQHQWLQVDFLSYTTVTHVATQGRHVHSEWVVNYKLNYSDDGLTFQEYKEPGSNLAKVLDGNRDNDTVVSNRLNRSITARFLRILPTKWNDRISLRMEIYGCPACIAPLGMENNAISDGQISASSQLDDDHGANQARLHSNTNRAGWSTLKNDPNQWLQVDLGAYTIVTRVATQGGKSISQWVTKYMLQYSDDRFIFQTYQETTGNSAMIFYGNRDSDTVVYNILKPPITAHFIRILPLEWHNHISLRIEIYGCPGCVKSLGMENQAISDAQVTASSQMDNTHSAREARLHSKSVWNQRGGWVALKNDLNQWLQVDLRTFTRVTRVATQGRDGYDQWVTKYRLQYSDDGFTFHSFKEIGSNFAKVFAGNLDYETVVYNQLSPPVATRFIRLIPVMWHNYISMRIEIYGCQGCIEALGMTRRTITDAQISASSELDNTHSAAQARLHSKAVGSKYLAWSARENDHHQWLQIDFGSSTKITRLATQGRNGFNKWVTKYNLSYSDDGVHFHFYKMMGESRAKVFEGNQDSDTVVYHALTPPITARFVRLLPVEWHNHISLRTEFYGCPGCIAPLGMDSGAITDAQISASSQWSNNYAASRARLHMRRIGYQGGSWIARKNDLNQWLQIDLGGYTTLTRVATQGRTDADQWVTKYKLQYSDDGVIFQFYKEPHQTAAKVFRGNQDRNTIIYNILNPSITTRFIRIKPVEWKGHICMRMEIYGCPGCTTPLGMENRAIPDSWITASSSRDNKHTAWQARLHLSADGGTGGGWSARHDDFRQWLKVELGGYTTVTRVATQGGNGRNGWVTKYRLQYSNSGNMFKYYRLRENSSAMVFEGNKDSNSVFTNRLSQPIRARYIRFIPIEWHNHISMRVEIYGCPGCMAPLGMENNQISDAQISASSVSDVGSSPGQARLHLPGGGGWSALKNDPHQWLQVDLRSYTTVTRVATQGRTGTKEWVTKYKLEYCDDGMNFQFYKEVGNASAKVFLGNRNSDTVVSNALNQPIATVFIRILPEEWNVRISMRMELYGCPACVSALGVENGEIPDAHITASSQLDDNNGAALARLRLKKDGPKQGGWSALYNDFGQWIQVDLGGSTRVTRVATQGRNAHDAWVVKYRLQYGEDLGINFTFVKKSVNSSAKIFYANHDSETVVYNVLAPPITARLIRILPVEWHNQISMRLEVYGCPVPSSTTTAPPTEQTTKTTSSEKISSSGNEKPKGTAQLRKDSKVSAIVAPVVVFVLVALILLVGFFYWRRRRSNENLEIQQVTFQKSGEEPLEGIVNPVYDGGELQFGDTKEA